MIFVIIITIIKNIFKKYNNDLKKSLLYTGIFSNKKKKFFFCFFSVVVYHLVKKKNSQTKKVKITLSLEGVCIRTKSHTVTAMYTKKKTTQR